ncbi:CheR family methyltransferase [Angustibacter luteus]|uniref:protein-glutamate O-methyltransferase n=1 Tax=Angustibacter luteus TaxID=658456 RepID=A0ABW1JI39_9ACTN
MSIAADAFDFVCALVHRESALVLGAGKEYLVESRLLPLARAQGDPDVETFVNRARRQPGGPAQREIVEALTTNETSWFRDSEPFVGLRDLVVPELVAARSLTRRLRVWSAACSSGQEPYSIAMVLGDAPQLAGWSIDVLGTDLSLEMVERCREGRYSQLEVNRGLPATSLVKHFERDGAAWRVNQSLAARTTFRQLNLARPLVGLGTFDVVFLRNVLIYFDLATKADVLRRVRKILAPDGYLFLGAPETTMGIDDMWQRQALGRGSVYRLMPQAARGVA